MFVALSSLSIWIARRDSQCCRGVADAQQEQPIDANVPSGNLQ